MGRAACEPACTRVVAPTRVIGASESTPSGYCGFQGNEVCSQRLWMEPPLCSGRGNGAAYRPGLRKKKLLAAASLAEGMGCILQVQEPRVGCAGELLPSEAPQKAVPPVQCLPSLGTCIPRTTSWFLALPRLLPPAFCTCSSLFQGTSSPGWPSYFSDLNLSFVKSLLPSDAVPRAFIDLFTPCCSLGGRCPIILRGAFHQ